jgi:hypothetical protein
MAFMAVNVGETETGVPKIGIKAARIPPEVEAFGKRPGAFSSDW